MENGSCNKQAYKTKKLAQTVRNIRIRSKRKADDLKIYLCRYCNDWHLTSHYRNSARGRLK